MPKISEQRIRQAAEQLVDYRWNSGDAGTATDAGRDMREWQLGGTRIMRAAKKAVSRTKQKSQPQKSPQQSIESLRSQFPWVGSTKDLLRTINKEFGTQGEQLLKTNPQKIATRLKAMEDKMSETEAEW
jgi:hypothetical protein